MNELLTKYELMLIIDANMTNEEKETIFKAAADAVQKSGGKVINGQVWLDKHKFTFEIKKCSEGTYYLINFEGEGSCVDKIQPILKLNEKILRFAFTKVE